MLIIPAIDLLGGKCVRLYKGDYDKVLFARDDPLEIAKRFKDCGAEWIHIVDLDGAKEGKPCNFGVIAKIAEAVEVNLEVGGGFRRREDLEKGFSLGINRIVLGTSALNKDFLKQMLALYGEKIAVALDVREGKITVEGWRRDSPYDALEFAQEMERMGVHRIIYTNVSRDGTLRGVDLEGIRKLRERISIPIIASGGVSSWEDLRQLSQMGVEGVIMGRAIYEGSIDLKKAIDVFQRERRDNNR